MLQSGKVALERREDLLQRAEPRICAFDIETTKLPLQFPNSEHDQVHAPLSHLSPEQSFISRLSASASFGQGGFTCSAHSQTACWNSRFGVCWAYCKHP